MSDAPAEEPPVTMGDPPKVPPTPPVVERPWKPLLAAAITTAAVTAASYGARGPLERYGATLVGVGFLASTWWLVLRHDEAVIRAHGLSLGGLMEPARIDPRRLLRDARTATGWALLAMAVTFPPFAVGYRFFYACSLALHRTIRCLPVHFALHAPPSILDEVGGQLVVIALPEEAFFRGYLQTALDRVWPPRWRVLGADLGPAWLVSAAIFAVGHVLTRPEPARLAVFFPALLFGWLRKRTGGIGAGVLFHAACNLFSGTLGRGYHF